MSTCQRANGSIETIGCGGRSSIKTTGGTTRKGRGLKQNRTALAKVTSGLVFSPKIDSLAGVFHFSTAIEYATSFRSGNLFGGNKLGIVVYEIDGLL